VIDRLANVSSVAPGRIDARTALDIVSKHLYPNASFTYRSAGTQGKGVVFDGGAFFHSRPQVTQVALPLSDGSLASGWRVETWAAQTNQLHYTIVDGEGQILEVESRTANDSYNVFVVDPDKGAQQVVAGPAPAMSNHPPVGSMRVRSRLFRLAGTTPNPILIRQGEIAPTKAARS